MPLAQAAAQSCQYNF